MNTNQIEYKGYIATLHFDIEDNILYGEIEGLNDVVTFEFERLSEAKEKFCEALDDYLDMCKEIGKEPEKQYRGVFNVRVSPNTHKELVLRAKKLQTTMNNLVETAIDSYLENTKEPNVSIVINQSTTAWKNDDWKFNQSSSDMFAEGAVRL